MSVLNTKKDALALLGALRDMASKNAELYHLSTLLCGAHRRSVLNKVQRALECERKGTGAPVLLTTTQVIEAGVDIDFPRVLRAKAPLDRMIQAAGRCNREGLRARELSEVVLMNPAEGTAPPGEYRTAIDVAWNLLTRPDGPPDLTAPDVATAYFARLYQMVELDKKDVLSARKVLDFPAVADKVKLIPDDTVPVLVPYFEEKAVSGPRSKTEFDELVDRLRSEISWKNGLSKSRWQEIQRLTVAVRYSELPGLLASTSIAPLIPDQLYLWTSKYDPVTGIGGTVGYAVEDLIS